MTPTDRYIWSATAEVTPKPGSNALQGATGAYVAVVGIGLEESQFRSRVSRAMDALEFDVVGLEDLERIDRKNGLKQLGELMSQRAQTLSETNPVEVGTFQAFSDEEDDT